jgi:Tol biopolymer transport system component/predicted Ser/Thr protein kinase
MIGRTLSHYAIFEKLGEGGMGVVYKARDLQLGRFVALKFLPGDRLSDPQRRRRFLTEAKAVSALNHAHIVTIHEIAQVEALEFIVMEYIEGTSLDRVISKAGLPLDEALRFASEIADALAAAHAAGILHRDLKPSNVMVTPGGLVKLLDFGLAKLIERPEIDETDATRTMLETTPVTEEGRIVGTAAYMSPEQAEGRKLDGRSDIFSFGAVLYEMLTGRPAFRGASSISILAAVLKEEPPSAGSLRVDLPMGVVHVLNRCLRKDPNRRFQTVRDLKAALADLEEDTEFGVGARVSTAKRARGLWVAGTLAVVALVAAGLYFRPASVPEAAMQIIPLTSDPGNQSAPTFAPDGKQVAYIWDGEHQNNVDIYVKMISTGSQLRLTSDPAYDGGPVWSPDGNYIAFFRNVSPEKCAILLISPLGGSERKVADRWTGLGMGMDWSPDSKWLAMPDRSSSSVPFGLFLVSVETGEKTRLTSGRALGDAAPAFSPNGRMLAFTRTRTDSLMELEVLDLDERFLPRGEPRRLTDDSLFVNMSHWTSDGRSIIFSARARGASAFSLWRIDPWGKSKPQPLPFAHGDVRSFAVARSGHRLVYPQVVIDTNLWRIGLSDGRTATPEQLTTATVRDQNAQFSPDGTRIVFDSDRSGQSELWTAKSDGSNQQALVAIRDAQVAAGRWSPDGETVAFGATIQGHTQIYTISAEGGWLRQLTHDPGENTAPSWSRDGKWIYFASERTGIFELWKIPREGGHEVQITQGGGFYAEESMDGKVIYFEKSRSRGSLWSLPVEGGPEVQVLDAVGDRTWTVSDDGIYFSDGTSPAVLQFFRFANQRVTSLARLAKPLIAGMSVSPDRRWLLYSEIDQSGGNLMLVENFR